MKFVLSLLAIAFLSTGCLKKDTGCSYSVSNRPVSEAEIKMVTDYLDSAGNSSAIRHNSGLYYEIITPGTGTTPTLCSQIAIAYKGQLTNGSIFDQNTEAVFVLGTLIEGWKIGLPLLKPGGKIMLYIPPSLGYGPQDVRDNSGNVVIPGNSVLVFEVTLINSN